MAGQNLKIYQLYAMYEEEKQTNKNRLEKAKF